MSQRLRAVVDRLDERRFDGIFAVRVWLFHADAERAHRLGGRWLAAGGRILAVYDEP